MFQINNVIVEKHQNMFFKKVKTKLRRTAYVYFMINYNHFEENKLSFFLSCFSKIVSYMSSGDKMAILTIPKE